MKAETRDLSRVVHYSFLCLLEARRLFCQGRQKLQFANLP